MKSGFGYAMLFDTGAWLWDIEKFTERLFSHSPIYWLSTKLLRDFYRKFLPFDPMVHLFPWLSL